VRRSVRFLTGILAGTGLLAGYLSTVGVETVLARATAIAPWALALVVVLVVLEGIADGLGVWASIAPLGEGLSGPRSVQFALAGDFFDILSPAGPVSSEPIMARFFSVATETGYSDALGVRSVAKYIKSITQVLCSALVGLAVLAESPDAATILTMLGLSVVGLVVVAVLVLTARGSLSSVLVAACTPVVARLSALYREDAHDRSVVSAAIDRYWERIVAFRGRPGLLVLIALGGVFEQLLTAVAIWIALAGTGTTVSLLPIFVVVPLPQVASVVPVPGSLGAYDLLLAGALVVVTDAPAAGATAAVLVVRTVALPFGAVTGGICAVSLRGWRPSLGG
jgi:uncharacterized membrane protein YbhN (UPF0104 family)